jgi:hypothetical protein
LAAESSLPPSAEVEAEQALQSSAGLLVDVAAAALISISCHRVSVAGVAAAPGQQLVRARTSNHWVVAVDFEQRNLAALPGQQSFLPENTSASAGDSPLGNNRLAAAGIALENNVRLGEEGSKRCGNRTQGADPCGAELRSAEGGRRAGRGGDIPFEDCGGL